MVTIAPPTVFSQILDPANRADPYRLYAELRTTPVSREADGSYVVSTYARSSTCSTTRGSAPWTATTGTHRAARRRSSAPTRPITTGCDAS